MRLVEHDQPEIRQKLVPLPTALLALPIGIAAAVAANLLADRFVYRFHRRARSAPAIFIVASVGVMFVLNGVVRFVVGPDDRYFSDGARFLLKARAYTEEQTLADEDAIPPATPAEPPEAPRWTRPLEEWTEEERLALGAQVKEWNPDAQVGTTKGGQVTVRIGSDDYVLVGEHGGKPLFRMRPWVDEGRPDPRQASVDQVKRLLVRAEQARARSVGTPGEAAAQAKVDTFSDAVAGMQRRIDDDVAARRSDASKELEELKDADLFAKGIIETD